MTNRLTRFALVAAGMCAAFAAADVAAQPGQAAQEPVIELIGRATAALRAGQNQQAVELACTLAGDRQREMLREDRAEAWRLCGLAHFFLGHIDQARGAFKECLVNNPEAYITPAEAPDEAHMLFSEAKAQNFAEIEDEKPKPKKKLNPWLNIVPAGGQFQNGQPTKAWILLGSMVAFTGAHTTSFFLVRRWCDSADNTCDGGGTGKDRTSEARAMKAVNTVSGAALIAAYTYSVIDGFVGYRRIQREQEEEESQSQLSLSPTGDGVGVMVFGTF